MQLGPNVDSLNAEITAIGLRQRWYFYDARLWLFELYEMGGMGGAFGG